MNRTDTGEMTRPLKVFYGNYDGKRFGLVAARSQKDAARLIGTSLYDFRRFWAETSSESERDIALAHPETVFLKRGHEKWEKRQ